MITLSALLIISVASFAQAQNVINTYVTDSIGTMLTDPSGNIVSSASCDQQFIIATNIKNSGRTTESFKVLYTIYESSTGNMVYTSSAAGTIQAGATQEVSVSWVAANKSELYKISEEVYDNAGNLATSTGTMVKVSCDAQSDTKKSETPTMQQQAQDPPREKPRRPANEEGLGSLDFKAKEDVYVWKIKKLEGDNKQLKEEIKKLKDAIQQTLQHNSGSNLIPAINNIASRMPVFVCNPCNMSEIFKGVNDDSTQNSNRVEAANSRAISKLARSLIVVCDGCTQSEVDEMLKAYNQNNARSNHPKAYSQSMDDNTDDENKKETAKEKVKEKTKKKKAQNNNTVRSNREGPLLNDDGIDDSQKKKTTSKNNTNTERGVVKSKTKSNQSND